MKGGLENRKKPAAEAQPPSQRGILQRKCACDSSARTSGRGGGCACEPLEAPRRGLLQTMKLAASRSGDGYEQEADETAHAMALVLRTSGQPLDSSVRADMEPRFHSDFSHVRVYSDEAANDSARAMNALAYTAGHQIVFGAGQYAPQSAAGRRTLAHELAHVVQQTSGRAEAGGIADAESTLEGEADAVAEQVVSGSRVQCLSNTHPSIQRQTAPYITKVTVNLTPPESATLQWSGTAPSTAPGSDSFTVSTGKGYSDPGDAPGTCTRTCCSGAATQCAAPHNEAGRVGSCCTPIGTTFYTGVPRRQHNGWNWWTPVEPVHTTLNRGIALHQHDTVTGDAIGHGCIRMVDANAHRIYLHSRGAQTNVTITGVANPVQCTAAQQCSTSTGTSTGAVQQASGPEQMAAVPVTRPDEELPGSGSAPAEVSEEVPV